MPGKYERPREKRKAAPESVKKTPHKSTLAEIVTSALFAVVGIAVAVAAVAVCGRFAKAEPMLLTPPQEARSSLVTMLDGVCEGDYAAASGCILGTPSLGVDREAADELGVLYWDAFVESASYELVGECYATENGVAQDITFNCLDLNSVTGSLRERSQALLEERIENTTDLTEIYDENNDYREDVVMEVLYEAARDALAEDAVMITVELTVNLKYQDGKWWVVADKALLDAISGGVLF